MVGVAEGRGTLPWSTGCGHQSVPGLLTLPLQTISTKETSLAPDTKDAKGERETERDGKSQRQRDSEKNSTLYSFLLSAHQVLDTLLDPGTVDVLIGTAKDQLLTLLIITPITDIY